MLNSSFDTNISKTKLQVSSTLPFHFYSVEEAEPMTRIENASANTDARIRKLCTYNIEYLHWVMAGRQCFFTAWRRLESLIKIESCDIDVLIAKLHEN